MANQIYSLPAYMQNKGGDAQGPGNWLKFLMNMYGSGSSVGGDSVANPYSSPGDVPYSYSGDPSAARLNVGQFGNPGDVPYSYTGDPSTGIGGTSVSPFLQNNRVQTPQVPSLPSYITNLGAHKSSSL